jgi:hypothetical protein
MDKLLWYQYKYRGNIVYTDKELVQQIIKNKINHDKILIEKFQRIIYSIRNNNNNNNNNKSNSEISGNKELGENKEKKLIIEFKPRLSNIKILNDEFVLFLQNWKSVCSSATINSNININNINVINNYIDSKDINSSNNEQNTILIKYLLIQLSNLLDMNTEKTNITLCNLIALIFDEMWSEYEPVKNYQMNKFLLVLYSGTDENAINTFNVDDIPTEKISVEEKEKLPEAAQKEINDQEDDFKEEQDAIDVEGTDPEDLDLGEQDIIMYDREQD